ncbi:MAG: glucose dehydrogenase [Pirellulaceae bacterium]|nr:MAG: glucose dehydrogenase [Pirellulaceae bacterium]
MRVRRWVRPRRRQIAGGRWIVTGASRGIGQALAECAAGRGARLLLVARSADRLERLAQQLAATAEVHYLAGDLTEPQFRQQIGDWVGKNWAGCDVLINNAGVGSYGPLAEAPESRLRAVMELDFFAPILLAQRLLPWLKQGRDPLIANIGSVLGYCAVPWKAEYCAAKAALRMAVDAWRAELAGSGVDVLLVSPSTVETSFFDHLAAGSHPPHKRRGASPQWIALQTLKAIEHRRSEVVLTWEARALVWVSRFFPALLRWANAVYARRCNRLHQP